MKNKKQLIINVIIASFFLLSFAYLTKGFYTLIFDYSKEGARDLLERWREQQYIYNRIYPYGMNWKQIIPEIGVIHSGGYPPWAFFTGFFIFPPLSWTLTRYYQGLLNLLSLGIISYFAYQIGSPYGKKSQLFFIGICLAISSNCTTLNNGQYGIIINALLVGVYWLINANKNQWSGILMGMALAKPSISAPYFLAFLIKKKIKSAIISIVYIIFGTVIIAWLTKLNSFKLLNRFIQQIKYIADDGFSAVNIFINWGLKVELIIIILIIGAIIFTVITYFILQNYSLLTIFAIASVIGRVFAYHRLYDNVMLVFLLLALWQLAFSQRQKIHFAMAIIVGLTLWLPASFVLINYSFWQSLQIVIWMIALFHLLLFNRINNLEKEIPTYE